jgi:hypothetical protein
MHPRLPRLRDLLLTATALLALGVAPARLRRCRSGIRRGDLDRLHRRARRLS